MAKTERKSQASRKKESSGGGLPPWVPYAFGIGIFLIITMVYFSPAFQGKELMQSDILQGRGMSREIVDWREATGEEALWTNQMFGGMPTYQTSLASKGNLFEKIDNLIHSVLPRPVGYIFFLFLGFYFLLRVLKVDPWISALIAGGYGLSAYFYQALDAGHNSKMNAMAYIAPMFAGILLAYQGRLWLGAGLTLLFTTFEINCNHPQITYYFLFVLFFLVISYLTVSIVKKQVVPFLKTSLVLLGAGLLAVGPNLPRLWTTYEYSKETIRGKNDMPSEKNPEVGLKLDYALQWSYGIGETMNLMIPNFMGGASNGDIGKKSRTHALLEEHPKLRGMAYQDGTTVADELTKSWPTYWGDQPFTGGPVYIGAILIFLFFMGIILVDSRYRWWIVTATLLGIALSWGRHYLPLTQLFFDHVPMYNRFRIPSLLLSIAQFTIPLMAALALSRIFSEKDKPSLRQAWVALGFGTAITAGVCLILAAGASGMFDYSRSTDAGSIQRMLGQVRVQLTDMEMNSFLAALKADRAALLSADALRSAGLILAAAAFIFVYLRGFINNARLIYLGLGALIVLDLYPIDRRYLNERSFVDPALMEQQLNPSPTDKAIKRDTDPHYRVHKVSGDPFQEARTSYHHKTVGGYHPAKLRRYADLIGHVLSPDSSGNPKLIGKGESDLLFGYFQGINQQLQGQPFPKQMYQSLLQKMPAMNMLNTKYVILPNGDYIVNPYRMGNAWFVSEIMRVNTAAEEVDSIVNLNPAKTAIIGKDFADYVQGFNPSKDSTGSIKLTSYKPYEMVYDFNAKSEQMVVFSEIYYDGNGSWKVTIDDQPVKYCRVNFLLRGLRVPGGKHKIVFLFQPRSYYLGNTLALVFSLLVLGLVAGAVYLDYKERISGGGTHWFNGHEGEQDEPSSPL